jgi:hypothetical protein
MSLVAVDGQSISILSVICKKVMPYDLNGKHHAHLIEAARCLHVFYSIVFFLATRQGNPSYASEPSLEGC